MAVCSIISLLCDCSLAGILLINKLIIWSLALNIRNIFRITAILVVSGAAIGCKSMPVSDSVNRVAEFLRLTSSTEDYAAEAVVEPKESLFGELDQFFNDAPAGAEKKLDKTPWGERAEIVVSAPYYAASGRKCRGLKVKLVASKQMRDELVCDTASGYWIPVRAVTHHKETL